jgi:DNA-binding NtrC family response regulator
LPLAVVLPLSPPAEGERAEAGSVWAFLRAFGRRTSVFLYGSRQPAEACREALQAGAQWVLNADAPGFVAELRERLVQLGRDVLLRLEEQRARAALFAERGLVGASAAWQEVFRRAILASQFRELPVLIVGGRGTPRFRLAAAIHDFDPRRSGRPFFALDCAGLGEVLAGDGGRREGPVDVVERWQALLAAADGGTVFLDRVPELDAPLQGPLLSAVQAGLARPDGGEEPRTPVRFIAAAPRLLDEAAGAGRLDAELGHWLGLFRIEVPALCGRHNDIAAQARHALRMLQAGRERAVTDFDPAALEALQGLPWEGNTRQLERTIREALAAKERGTLLRLEDLPGWVREASRERVRRAAGPQGPESEERQGPAETSPLDQGLEEYDRQLLDALLRRHPRPWWGRGV